MVLTCQRLCFAAASESVRLGSVTELNLQLEMQALLPNHGQRRSRPIPILTISIPAFSTLQPQSRLLHCLTFRHMTDLRSDSFKRSGVSLFLQRIGPHFVSLIHIYYLSRQGGVISDLS